MAHKPTTREMSDAHEEFLATLLGGRRTKGSGNQFNDQMDGRNDHHMPCALAWDGKSTFAGTATVGREMWRKARTQAGAEIPLVALRFYNDYTLKPDLDLVVLDAHAFAEILELARRYKDLCR